MRVAILEGDPMKCAGMCCGQRLFIFALLAIGMTAAATWGCGNSSEKSKSESGVGANGDGSGAKQESGKSKSRLSAGVIDVNELLQAVAAHYASVKTVAVDTEMTFTYGDGGVKQTNHQQRNKYNCDLW